MADQLNVVCYIICDVEDRSRFVLFPTVCLLLKTPASLSTRSSRFEIPVDGVSEVNWVKSVCGMPLC
jgi:hypothetical protein